MAELSDAKLQHYPDGSVTLLIRPAGSGEWPLPNLLRHRYIQEIYRLNDCNKVRTANALGMHRRTLQKALKKDAPRLRVSKESYCALTVSYLAALEAWEE